MIPAFITDYAAPVVVAAKVGISMICAQYFSQEEFREWAEDISPRIVTMLDVLRFRFGRPIAISASDYAYGS